MHYVTYVTLMDLKAKKKKKKKKKHSWRFVCDTATKNQDI